MQKISSSVLVVCGLLLTPSLMAAGVNTTYNKGTSSSTPLYVTGNIIAECSVSDATIDLGRIPAANLAAKSSVTQLVQPDKPLTVSCEGGDESQSITLTFAGEQNDDTLFTNLGSAENVSIGLFHYVQNTVFPLKDGDSLLVALDSNGKAEVPIGAMLHSYGNAAPGSVRTQITVSVVMP